MKKIFVLISALIFTTSLHAQDEQKLHFGLKAAPSLAWLGSDTKGFESSGTKLGFSYGLITEFNFSTHYAFATGVDITYRGGKSKYSTSVDSTTFNFESDYTLQYVELPITLKLKTNEIGYLTYFLQFGVAPAINIRARADQKITTQVGTQPVTVVEDKDIDVKDGVNNFNLSMIIGGGIEYTLSGSTVLLTGITFNNGFLDVFDSGDLKVHSNYLALTVGILF